jgi:hypothetical protein
MFLVLEYRKYLIGGLSRRKPKRDEATRGGLYEHGWEHPEITHLERV